MSDDSKPWGPRASSATERLTRATRALAREMRAARDEGLREQYRDIHPSEWPVDHPDWGSSRFEPWGGPKWEPRPDEPKRRAGGPPRGVGGGLLVSEIIEVLADDPDMTQEGLAEKLGKSDRRVRQVLERDGMDYEQAQVAALKLRNNRNR